MKKIILILFLSYGLMNILQSQTTDEQSIVLQKCIDLSEMQQYYPTSADENLKKIYIMQYPVIFSSSITVFKFDKKIEFKTRPEIYALNATCFYLFKTFKINNNTANISFSFYYDYITSKKMIEGNVELEKVENSWIVKETKIERK